MTSDTDSIKDTDTTRGIDTTKDTDTTSVTDMTRKARAVMTTMSLNRHTKDIDLIKGIVKI